MIIKNIFIEIISMMLRITLHSRVFLVFNTRVIIIVLLTLFEKLQIIEVKEMKSSISHCFAYVKLFTSGKKRFLRQLRCFVLILRRAIFVVYCYMLIELFIGQ